MDININDKLADILENTSEITEELYENIVILKEEIKREYANEDYFMDQISQNPDYYSLTDILRFAFKHFSL